MIINHNMSAMFADRVLGITQQKIQSDIEKLSSGQRITKAADDASGLAVSEKMRAQIRGLNQAEKNIQNGVSFIQTTEGYLQETQGIVGRIRELAVQSANGIYTQNDRAMIQVEVSQLVDEVNRVASQAQFNGMNMLTGAFSRTNAGGAGLQIQMGANVDQNKKIFIGTMTAAALGLSTSSGQGTQFLSLASPSQANMAIAKLDNAINKISSQRADLGAYQNRFEMAAKGVNVAAENLTASESRIRDVDMAKEMVDYTKNQVLAQAGNAMLAQANVNTRSVLQLLG
ncbi:MAG: flagellin [Spirochaetales bacterium]|jgi:flagellin|nr:flagellin [Spirochaetales bacterium]